MSKYFMHVSLDPKKITRYTSSENDDLYDLPRSFTRMSYSGVDYHMDWPVSRNIDEDFEQEDRFLHEVQTFLRAKGVNATIDSFE